MAMDGGGALCNTTVKLKERQDLRMRCSSSMHKKSEGREKQGAASAVRFGAVRTHDDNMMQLALAREVAGPRQQIEGAVTRHELRTMRLLMHFIVLFSVNEYVARCCK
jgi:hypothetical protein